MDFIKKQSVSTWLSLGAFILTLVAIIIYGVNVSGGYFLNATSIPVVVFSVLALVLICVIIVLAQFDFDGILGTILKIAVDLFKIIVPMFLMICMLSFLMARVEGLAYIYGSNEEILATIQTPENLASASGAIAGIVIFGIAAVVSMVATFFNFKKNESSTEVNSESAAY